MRKLLFFIAIFISFSLFAQEHNASLKYTVPSDKLVQAKIQEWRKIKFGLLMH